LQIPSARPPNCLEITHQRTRSTLPATERNEGARTRREKDERPRRNSTTVSREVLRPSSSMADETRAEQLRRRNHLAPYLVAAQPADAVMLHMEESEGRGLNGRLGRGGRHVAGWVGKGSTAAGWEPGTGRRARQLAGMGRKFARCFVVPSNK
jgi:hypothetical protein